MPSRRLSFPMLLCVSSLLLLTLSSFASDCTTVSAASIAGWVSASESSSLMDDHIHAMLPYQQLQFHLRARLVSGQDGEKKGRFGSVQQVTVGPHGLFSFFIPDDVILASSHPLLVLEVQPEVLAAKSDDVKAGGEPQRWQVNVAASTLRTELDLSLYVSGGEGAGSASSQTHQDKTRGLLHVVLQRAGKSHSATSATKGSPLQQQQLTLARRAAYVVFSTLFLLFLSQYGDAVLKVFEGVRLKNPKV